MAMPAMAPGWRWCGAEVAPTDIPAEAPVELEEELEEVAVVPEDGDDPAPETPLDDGEAEPLLPAFPLLVVLLEEGADWVFEPELDVGEEPSDPLEDDAPEPSSSEDAGVEDEDCDGGGGGEEDEVCGGDVDVGLVVGLWAGVEGEVTTVLLVVTVVVAM